MNLSNTQYLLKLSLGCFLLPNIFGLSRYSFIRLKYLIITYKNQFFWRSKLKLQFFVLISELSSDIFLIKIGDFTATSIVDFGTFIWWSGFFPMAIFWLEWRWLPRPIQFTRSKWTVHIRIRWSNHLFNPIFKSYATWKRWSMCFFLLLKLNSLFSFW